MNIIEDVANHLADMPGLNLPVEQFLFLADTVSCVCLFPDGGANPLPHSEGAIDRPSVQIQVRAASPQEAYVKCEEIRLWLRRNPPTGYFQGEPNDSQPYDLTSDLDLHMEGGPVYRFGVNIELDWDDN